MPDLLCICSAVHPGFVFSEASAGCLQLFEAPDCFVQDFVCCVPHLCCQLQPLMLLPRHALSAAV